MGKNPSIPSSVRKRVGVLRAEIDDLRYRYHVLDDPSVSDAVYDSLTRELRVLEAQYPELVTPDSPTQRVGGKARKEFVKTRHRTPMLSLNDAFTDGEFFDWIERLRKLEPLFARQGFYVEMKMDGLALELEYVDHVLRIGSTRGNGIVGEDVTVNVRTIRAIPLRLRSISDARRFLVSRDLARLATAIPDPLPDSVIVRGEAFLAKKEFARINRAQERLRATPYANPRNVAAGSIRQLDPSVTASRKLDFVAYDIITDLGQQTHEEAHALLSAFGFKTNAHNRRIGEPKDVVAFRALWEQKRETLPYEIDGLVVTVNALSVFQRLGVVGKAPRGAMAFKFAYREATTVLSGIRVQVGRTGALTPVADLRPVSIGGVMVSHATLHNADEVKRLDARVGDTVVVGRAGDVIPKVKAVVKRLRPKTAKPFLMPRRCPRCKTPVVRDTGGVVIRCPNRSCPARNRETLYHFVSRAAFDIAGLGPETIDKLVDSGMVENPADFFELKEDDFQTLEGFADVSAAKIVAAIAAKKRIALPRFLIALGIPHVGDETAHILAARFGSLSSLAKVSEDELHAVPDIGPIVAHAITAWFQNSENKKVLEKLHRLGVRARTVRAEKLPQVLAGKAVVFTGELSSLTRDEAKRRARDAGADVSESVSKKTSFVVAGKNPGLKLDKAKKLGIEVLTEKEFLRLMGG